MVMIFNEDAVRERVYAIAKAKGINQYEIADRVGSHYTTVNRVLKGKSPLDENWLRQFAAALEVDVEELISAPALRLVSVRGDVQAGHWAESWEWPRDDWFDVSVESDPRARRFALHGARTKGPSMDRRYPEGTILIFTDLVETGEQLVPGRRYIVERERADGLRETTVKSLWQDTVSGALWLMPESTDPRFQEPIAIEGGENDTVRIVGRVVGSYQRE